MNEIPATQNIGDVDIIQTQEIIMDGVVNSMWGKLISLTTDPCFDLSGKDEFIIGRSADADIIFPENYISSNHCCIFINREFIPNTIYIVDKSTNGTYINGVRLIRDKQYALKHVVFERSHNQGDLISLIYSSYKQTMGSHAFIFQDPSKPLRVAESFISQDFDGIEDRYILEGQLGKGTFGIVRLCREIATGDMYAAKIIDLKQCHYREDKIQAIIHEAELLGSLSHPNIPLMKEIIRGKKQIYIIMELVTGGDLFDRLKALGHYNEVDARALMKNIFEAIQYLHDREIVHRDIKPENILLMYKNDNTMIKVTDFGLAKSTTDGLHTYCGTPQYFAPEVLERRNNPSPGTYGKAVDMWSLGVLMYAVLAGELPFDQNILSQQIREADVQFHGVVWSTISAEAKDLISKLIVKDPAKRLTVAQALKHPWIENIAVSQIASQIASQLFSQKQSHESPLQGLFCCEYLSKNAATDSHNEPNAQRNDVNDANVIADSQFNEDEVLWKNQRYAGSFVNTKQLKLVVASSIEEEKADYIFEPMTGEKRQHEEVTTPDNKRPDVEANSSSHSTPFRSGVKAALQSSIFDVKRKEPSPKRAGKTAKKPMIPTNNILSYFSPRKNE